MGTDAVAAALAKTVASRIEQARTLTRRGTVTAVGTDGTVQFSVGSLGTRIGIHLADAPSVGDVIAYLDEGNGMPLVLGTVGKRVAWTPYTPTWTSNGSAPSIGDGTLAGRYRRDGATISLVQRLVIGSTTTVGSGYIRLSLPSGMTFGPMQQVGSAFWYDASTGILTRGDCIGDPGLTYLYLHVADAVDPGNSSGLANGDVITHQGTFELA